MAEASHILKTTSFKKTFVLSILAGAVAKPNVSANNTKTILLSKVSVHMLQKAML